MKAVFAGDDSKSNEDFHLTRMFVLTVGGPSTSETQFVIE
jgi:hypothetical protein